MEFRYRYVPFGTSFVRTAGIRSASVGPLASELHDNELAVDVGGTFMGIGGLGQDPSLAVVDHHFDHPDQFPSASAGVLHLKDRIQAHAASAASAEAFWLVTHIAPDFDAFCAMFLARRVIEGRFQTEPPFRLRPNGWRAAREEDYCRFDWFAPQGTLESLSASLSPSSRCALLLASYAAHVDHGRRLRCPSHRSLHALLAACELRGRTYRDSLSGAMEFFEETERAITERGLNPLIDGVLDRSELFAPERELLEQQRDAYQRDIGAARKTMVFVHRVRQPYSQFLAAVAEIPLVDELPSIVHELTAEVEPVDGLFLRDPECLLFKEWARGDLENSSSGKGFLFTAIAYSGGRPGGVLNDTDYWFTLDPEAAGSRHLYNVWTVLERQELTALAAVGKLDSGARCRPGYEKRAGERGPLMSDPWFDGPNYNGTLVATPSAGTVIAAPGQLRDLSDDPIAQLVERELSIGMFASDAVVEDFYADRSHHGIPVPMGGEIPELRARAVRFVNVRLSQGMHLGAPGLAAQVGQRLYRFLASDNERELPDIVATRLVVFDDRIVVVWNNSGVAVGSYDNRVAVALIREQVERIAKSTELLWQTVQRGQLCESLSDEDASMRHQLSAWLTEADSYVRIALQLEHDLRSHEGRFIRPFFDAFRGDYLTARFRQLRQSVSDRLHRVASDGHLKTLVAVQDKVAWIELFIITFYAAEFTQILYGHSPDDRWKPIAVALAAFAISLVALQPWHHSNDNTGRAKRWLPALLPTLLAISLIAALGWEGCKMAPTAEQPSGAAPSAPPGSVTPH